MKTSFTISDLSFRYGTTDTLQHISLMLPKNKIIGIIGPNGCGKSTLLAHLGRLKPSHGIIRLDDKYIEEYSARAYAQKVAIVAIAKQHGGGFFSKRFGVNGALSV